MMKLYIAVVLLSSSIAWSHEGKKEFGPLKSTRQMVKGYNVTLDDLDVYVVDPGQPGDGTKAVVWNHDMLGVTSGRTFELVERLASETEYTVLLPDYFRNQSSLPRPETYEWETVLQFDWYNKLKPYLISRGFTRVGAVGTCWGAYVVQHISVDPLIKSGFSVHPYHVEVMNGFGESEVEIYEAILLNGAFEYYGPTDQETDNVRPGGLADITLEDHDRFEEFHNPCIHGFFNRGDLSDPVVYECVERAYGNMTDLLADTL